MGAFTSSVARVEGAFNSKLAIYGSKVAILIRRHCAGSRMSEAGDASLFQMDLRVCRQSRTASLFPGPTVRALSAHKVCDKWGLKASIASWKVLGSKWKDVMRHPRGYGGNGWSECAGPR